MGKLSQDAVSYRREYLRNWRAKNRDKVREYNMRYWTKCAKRKEEAAERASQKEKEGDSING